MTSFISTTFVLSFRLSSPYLWQKEEPALLDFDPMIDSDGGEEDEGEMGAKGEEDKAAVAHAAAILKQEASRLETRRVKHLRGGCIFPPFPTV